MRVAGLVFTLVTSSAMAGDFYLPFRVMSSAKNPFEYYVDGRWPEPGGVSLANAQAASESAWNTWNQVQCASPRSKSLGLTGNIVVTPGDPNNGKNVTPVFVTSKSDPDYARAIGTDYVTAVTLPLTYSGLLLNCNIFLNAAGFAFATTAITPRNAIDVETVMLHEAGHCLGLGHFWVYERGRQNVMLGSVVAGDQARSLASADVGALCARNPALGAPGAPCNPDGSCDPGGKCYTQRLDGADVQFCATPCDLNLNEDCPLPLTCTASPLFSTSTRACLLPSGNVTAVGKACSDDIGCLSAVGTCIRPSAAPSGHSYWARGYCSQSCEAGQPSCPAGSRCTVLGGGNSMCLQSCRPGFADCRTDYACVLGSLGGVCVPMCYSNADCNDAAVDCRVCDGVCIDKQSPTGQIGDVCTDDSACGAGQVCAPVTQPISLKRQCTQQCGHGCGICPSGSLCVQSTAGLNCLRSCTGAGSCPGGLRCGDFPTGKACVPACERELDCPVGLDCVSGECRFTGDGGCVGALCVAPDGGGPVVVTPRDGGNGNTTPPVPCGCRSSPIDPMLLALAVLSLASRFARRSS